MSNSLDPDQDGQNVGPDLCPNCLQSLPADNTSRQRVNYLSARDNFCYLMIAFANSLDTDQVWHNVGPDLDPNCPERTFLKKVNFENSRTEDKKS